MSINIKRYNLAIISLKEDAEISSDGDWVRWYDVAPILDAIPRLMSNWPPSRDGMDYEILPTGIHAMRAALAKVQP